METNKMDFDKPTKFINTSHHIFVEAVDTRNSNKIKNTENLSKWLGRDLQNGFILDEKGTLIGEEFQEQYSEESRQKFGENILIFRVPKTFLWIAKQNMKDTSLILLFCGALCSLLLSFITYMYFNEEFTYIESVSIFFAITAIVMVSSITEYSQEQIFDKLERAKTDVDVKFIEFGKMRTKRVSEVLVGDLICFEPGDVLSADAIMVTNDPVQADESLLTGESVDIQKKQMSILYSGSSIQSGSGKAIVIAVGDHSSRGKILASLKKVAKKTPLQKKTEKLSEKLIKTSIFVTVLIFLISISRYAIAGKLTVKQFMKKFLESIALVVTIIPEGLLMATTMALSFGSKRLLKENNLVRDLSACEKMNNVSYLCTDKTGTLTHNKLVLRGYFTTKRKMFIKEQQKFLDHENDLLKWHLVQNMILNSSAFKNQNGEYIGSRIESTILKLLEKSGSDIVTIRKDAQILHRKPFISEDMYMSVIVQERPPTDPSGFYKDTDSKRTIVFFKGAPEKILKHCKYQFEDNDIVHLHKNKIKKFIHTEGKISQVRLAFAFRIIDEPDDKFLNINILDDLVFTGCFSFEDPLREDVEEKIQIVMNAGLKVVILTGDGPETAKYIADVCGIIDENEQIITGDVFRSLSTDELVQQIDKIRVIARATPSDKKKFVNILQKANRIVAVTGDGANDGPALRLADVGFAIGSHASDIAKECSSIVILEKDFDSLICAISWGRCVNDSIKKFFQLQFTATCATVLILSIVSVFSTAEDSIFSPVALLWINIYIDTLSAIALTSDRPDRSHLERNPEDPDAPIISDYMKRFILYNSIWIASIILLLFFCNFSKTIIFNIFFLSLMSTQICSRSLSDVSPIEKIFKNPYSLITNTLTIVLHVFFIQKASSIFKTEPLSIWQWFLSAGFATSLFPLNFLLRKTAFLRQ
ncbi:calcium-translocating P-type ATPase, PMCA-type [Pseudoloma neurophilia]|uniref:Calcium-transporting ATPase n=1 Tax=Pseudoloma neurophilia TaxID=146866 RepID=A0A0R0M2T9_9MICR|nr:calcium-translocating P-type ATPase, PMCA-type [Pseudoloma neurophilia]